MKQPRYPTEAEWQEIEKMGPGVRMYKGKRTIFYNGEKLWEGDDDVTGEYRIYDEEEIGSCKVVIIVLLGVEVIREGTFRWCENVEAVIMSDSVKRIEEKAFADCIHLIQVFLSRSLEYIGKFAFKDCGSLTSIFIPPTCREIGERAFWNCEKLIIVGLPADTKQGKGIFRGTALVEALPGDNYSVKDINSEEAYALHRACASFNLSADTIHAFVKEQGTIKGMKMPNTIGITPSQYLEANPFSDISEKEIINRFILETMGETE